jgi:hypothetical protein
MVQNLRKVKYQNYQEVYLEENVVMLRNSIFLGKHNHRTTHCIQISVLYLWNNSLISKSKMLTHYTAHNYGNNHYLIHCAKFSPPCLAQLQKAQRWLVALILLAIPPVVNMQLIKCRNCVPNARKQANTNSHPYCCRTCLYNGS